MYQEYLINCIDEKDINIKNNIENLIKFTDTKNIVCSHQYARLIKKYFSDINIGVLVDYPLAYSDIEYRKIAISNVVKEKYKYIAITIPFYYLVNRKYDKLREDIKYNNQLCGENIELRYILEYRKFDHNILAKACEILKENGIHIIYPSTGLFIDNLEDNILACSYLSQKTNINTIINGNAWTRKQVQTIIKSQMYGFSTNSLETLKIFNTYE